MSLPQPLQPLPSRVCGPLSGLCGFAVALFSGLTTGADATTVLIRALVSCVCCAVLGYVAGVVFEFVAVRVVVRERIKSGVAELASVDEKKTQAAEA